MTPEGKLNPQKEIKRNRTVTKKVIITNSVNTYLLSFLL